MTQRYAPGLFDRLMDVPPHSSPGANDSGWTLEQLKDAVARDLEMLFNTRAAMPGGVLTAYPEVSKSVLNYGLIDFAGMCLTSDDDRKKICAALRLAVERYEPRLHVVSAALRVDHELVNRVDFVICARLKADVTAKLVQFDAILKPSTQQFSIRKSGLPQEDWHRR
jgi:type VI secretion system protein ImpF